jgi:hypothetical protein
MASAPDNLILDHQPQLLMPKPQLLIPNRLQDIGSQPFRRESVRCQRECLRSASVSACVDDGFLGQGIETQLLASQIITDCHVGMMVLSSGRVEDGTDALEPHR